MVMDIEMEPSCGASRVCVRGKALSDVGLQMQVQVQRMAHDTEDGPVAAAEDSPPYVSTLNRTLYCGPEESLGQASPDCRSTGRGRGLVVPSEDRPLAPASGWEASGKGIPE